MTTIDANTLTLNGFEYVRKDSVSTTPQPEGNFCIVRCRNAGVHAGYVISRDNVVVKLENSRRLWRWWSKATLSELAMEGPLKSKMEHQKYGCVLPQLELTESDVCEIIPCTTAARIAIQAVKVWENE